MPNSDATPRNSQSVLHCGGAAGSGWKVVHLSCCSTVALMWMLWWMSLRVAEYTRKSKASGLLYSPPRPPRPRLDLGTWPPVGRQRFEMRGMPARQSTRLCRAHEHAEHTMMQSIHARASSLRCKHNSVVACDLGWRRRVWRPHFRRLAGS